MSQVKDAFDRIEPLFRSRYRIGRQVSTERENPFLLNDWVYFATSYSAAAEKLEDPFETNLFPRIQLYGHALECALKGYLVKSKIGFPKGKDGHNLVMLAILAEENGCIISPMQAIAVVQLHSLYFSDLGTETMYKSRYPVAKSEARESHIGNISQIGELVASICKRILE